MMLHCKLGKSLLITSITCVSLAIAYGPAYGRHPGLDLDAKSDAQIDAVLQAELDDEDLVACGLTNPNAPRPTEEMLDIIMCALGDDGDDEDEQGLDEDDLEAEVEEANTTLEDVVRAGLERADVIAFGQPSPGADLRFVVLASDQPASAYAPPDFDLYALKDGRINPGRAALQPVKLAIRAAIRAAR